MYQQELIRRLAKNDLGAFIKHTFPEYQFNWHHIHTIKTLQRLINGEIDRVIIKMPPRHGKSELVSRRLPAFLFGINPDMKIIGTSYSADLAHSMNSDIQRIMLSDEYRRVFPDTKLNTKNVVTTLHAKRNKSTFDIVDRIGQYNAAGVEGPIMGKGADVIIVDDTIKNHMQAESALMRKRIWKWFTADLYTRLAKDGSIIVVGTSWHQDDLIGRLIDRQPDTWTVIDFPAIKFHNDNAADERVIGEALWSGMFDLSALAIIKEQIGSRYWASLYQQTPSSEEGNIFLRRWFNRYNQHDFDYSTTVTNFYIDSAYTSDPDNDASAILAYCVKGNTLYIRSCISVRKEFPEFVKFLPEFVRQNGYTPASRIYIEPKASGLSIFQQIKRVTGLNIVTDKAPTEAKASRANAVTAKIEAGRVLFPIDDTGVDELIDQCCAFPSAKHDDMMDCLTAAIRLSFNRSTMKMHGRKIRAS